MSSVLDSLHADLRATSQLTGVSITVESGQAVFECGEPGICSSHLKVLSPSPAAAKVFKSLGFDSFIDIYDGVDEAIVAL